MWTITSGHVLYSKCSLYMAASSIREKQHFTDIGSTVAADWHELMVPLHSTLWDHQLTAVMDNRTCIAVTRNTTAPINGIKQWRHSQRKLHAAERRRLGWPENTTRSRLLVVSPVGISAKLAPVSQESYTLPSLVHFVDLLRYLLSVFAVSLVHHHHPAHLHHHARILDQLLTSLMAFSTLVLKPPFYS